DRRRQKDRKILNITARDVPFWQALDSLAAQSQTRVSLYQRDGVLALVDGPAEAPAGSYHGPFWVVCKRLTTVRDLESQAHYQLVTLEIAWEPGLRPFLLEARPRSLIVRDDRDDDLSAMEAGAGQAPVEGKLATLLDLRLPAAPRPATKLTKLQ